MYIFTVGVSHNGRTVYASIINSAAGRYLGRQPHLVRIAKALIETLDLSGKELNVTRDIGRTIGNTNIVETGIKDSIFYARQAKQPYSSRFVKNRSMEPSSKLSLILSEDGEGNYELTNIWIGPACPPFPGAPNEHQDSKEYWLSHALTAGSELIDAQSTTSACPY